MVPSSILLIDEFNTTTIQQVKDLEAGYKIYIYGKMDIPKDLIFDLLILCSKTYKLNINNPLLLYGAEIKFYRTFFNKQILECALEHCRTCEIRLGK